MPESEGSTPFAERLRALRERAGLTQEELAERAGVTAHAVSALERGTRTRPYPHTIRSLADALGVDDDERAGLIASVARRRSAAASPPVLGAAAATTVAPARLDVPATRLHGRDDDLGAVAALVRGGARLVTLTGVGGVGKTRLAVALADQLAPSFPDGLVEVSLAAITDADRVLPAIGRALGLSGIDGPTALDQVTGHLRPLRVLLVVDNLEHLLSAAGDLATLVAACPGVTVLATSRASLRVRSEHEYVVSPLALPPAEASSLTELEGSAAGALLLDRARAVGRLPTPEDAPALATLCLRLAGLPLALELAGAQLRHLAPATVVDRLDRLTQASGARDLPERQRTLRATLDWSCALLSEDELALFRVLGAFRGGATLEALESVATRGAGLAADGVLGLVDGLVAQSLVVAGSDPTGTRYRQLEPVAQYARTLLLGDEAARVFRAHAAWFERLAAEAAAGYEGAHQVDWLRRTEHDEANLLLAMDRSLDLGDAETAAWLSWWLWLYWWLRGQVVLGRRRAERCLVDGLAPALDGRAHLSAATMCFAGGDVDAAAGHWAQAHRRGLEAGDADVTSKGVAGLGLAALARGELDEAMRHFEESLVVGGEAGDAGRWLVTLAHVWLGTALMLQGRVSDAVARIGRGLDLARERGDRLATYVALFNLAQAALAAGDHDGARVRLEEGVLLSEQTRDRANLAYVVEALAVVEAAEHRPERVATLLGAAAALREAVGADVYGYYLPDEARRAAAEAAARDALGVDAYDDAADRGRSLDLDGVVAYALERDSLIA